MSIWRELDLCDGVAEFGDMNGEELDDLQADLFGDGQLGDDDDDDLDAPTAVHLNGEDDDLFDDTSDIATRRAAAVARQKRAADERIEAMAEQERLERELGFTQPVQRQIIPLRVQRPNDWWFSSAGAATMYSDDDHATEMVLALINRSLSSHAPPAGLGRVVDMPKRISDIRFEPWVAHTTTEVVDTNSVATFYTGLLPHLPDVAYRSVVFCFNLRRFAACKTKMSDGTILLFCGSAVCTGPKGPARSNAQCQRYVLWLNQLGIPATLQGYRLQNLVSKASAGWEIDLNLLHQKYPYKAEYKPWRFPGVIFRFDLEKEIDLNAEQSATVNGRPEDQIVVIAFKSSKTIITGSHTRAKTSIFWTFFENCVLREFKRVSSNPVAVSEAAYRRLVGEERSIIEFTCRNIHRLAAERATFDALADNEALYSVTDGAGCEYEAKARACRKRPFADTLEEFLIGNDATSVEPLQETPIAKFVDARVAALRGRDQGELIANWLARNATLINK